MQPTNRDIIILKKIIGYCGQIDEARQLLGNSLESLAQSNTYRNAVSMCILQIGELSTHLTEEFRSTHQDIPWKAIRGMRNVAAHHYGNFDTERLWNTVVDDIPVLQEKCQATITIPNADDENEKTV
jgi:uncharacterized protein with HEPN domain